MPLIDQGGGGAGPIPTWDGHPKAAGSPHSTPVPEEMDFDLFGPSSGSPSAHVYDDSTGAREWKCANGCTCSASGSADAHFADQLQQLMLQMLNNQNTALQQQ